MGILSSLYTGITGMSAQGEALSVYGDNIANSQTYGFKVSRPEFQDVIAKSLKGVLGGNQIGRGTRLASVSPVFTQGSLIQTESSTDLGISGDGFFVVEGVEGRGFSRAGAFHFDNEGRLINSDNYLVQGFQADDKGNITSRLGSISIDRTVIDANPTKEVGLQMNLDFRAQPGAKQFNPNDPDSSSDFATGVTVYDSVGSPHVVTVYFNKENDGQWRWRAMARGDEIVGGQPDTMLEQASGVLTFDTDGRLRRQQTDRSEFNFIGGAVADQEIKFNFGSDRDSGGDGLQVTQYGTGSEAFKTVQDGYTGGTLNGLSINNDGVLSGIYSNGEVQNFAQIALAKFENPEGLFKTGQNRFRESRLSGQPTIGAPNSGGRGRIQAKTLESSTTDIANEFINLMNSQRNFQANTRVISVADDMLSEVLNLKRT
jgi:flagellar hook protein FlgE